MVCLGYWIDEIQWLTMVILFIVALVTVSMYLVQYALVIVESSSCRMSSDSFHPLQKEDLNFLLKWLLSLNSWRSQWQVAWVTALNEEAKHKGGPLFLTFEEDQVQQPLELAIQPVVNVVKAVQKVVLCNIGGDSIKFVVHALSASADAPKCQSYDVQLSPFHLQLELLTKEKKEDILIKWSFLNASEINIKIQPKSIQEDHIIGTLEQSKTLKDILKHLVSSVSPSVILSTKTIDVKEAQDMQYSSIVLQDLSPPKPPRVHKLKLLVKNIQATLLNNPSSSGSFNCAFVTQLNDPFQKFFSSVSNSTTSFTWDDMFTFELNAKSKDLQLHILEDGESKDSLFFASATVPLDVFKKNPSGQHCFVLNSGSSSNYTLLGSITAEFFYIEPSESKSWKIPPLVPAARIEKDVTVMPCGTTNGALMATSIIDVKTNPLKDIGRLPASTSDSPVKTPVKVKVMEKDMLVQAISGHSAPISKTFSSSDTELLGFHDSDPVAEAAIQQLSQSSKMKSKSPRKKSTIIIEGISKDSETSLMIDYATSTDNSYQQEFPSYFKEAVSAEFIDENLSKHKFPASEQQENELDTRKLEDTKSEKWSSDAHIDQANEEISRSPSAALRKYKGGILRRGAKLFFRPSHHQKDPGMSQSHNDLVFLQQSDDIHRKSTTITRILNKNLLSKYRSKSKLNVFSGDSST